ncbi:MAG: M20/M25/M40 family metallo-hydrolase [Pirellulales bacterium]
MSETIRRSARGGALRHEMRGRFRQLSGALLAVMLATPIALAAETATESAESAAAVANARILDATQYLASDDLEGRGVGTEGLNLAAQYIAARFAELGLDTELFDGTPFQQFEMTVGSELGATNEVELTGPPAAGSDTATTIPLELGEDFTPMSIGGSGKFDLPLAFVGYGITGSEEMYDDYEGIDVQGKAVIILRHEPQQDNPHSVFDGTETSRHAPFVRKLANAYEHGAAAVIFCTGEHEILKDVRRALARYENTLEELDQLRTKFAATEHPSLAAIDEYLDQVGDLVEQTQRRAERVRSVYDPMLGFHAAGAGSEAREMPVLFIRREPLSKVLKATLGKDLSQLEAEIDQGPSPKSAELTGWQIAGDVSVIRTSAQVKNVIGVLEGSGPHADETIIIGAHYDHLGWGGPGSFVPDLEVVHNGADDNASGTVALIEVARQLAAREQPLPRRVVFVAFTGEERGLIGSAHYVAHPLFPLEKTVAMLNMDMVGRLNDEKLIVQGYDTASEFEADIDAANETGGFELTKNTGGIGPSDHASFYPHQIPVMHFFTGLHDDYHRPSDDADKVKIDGLRRVATMVADVAVRIAQAPERPTYQKSESKPRAGGRRSSLFRQHS